VHPGAMSLATRERTAPTIPVVGVVGAATALYVVVRIALGTNTGQTWDHEAMSTVYAGREAKLAVLSVLGRVSIGLVLAVTIGCVAAALMRGRVDLAIAAVVVVGGANASTQLLKHTWLDRPDFGFGTNNSLPSGHTTLVASAVAAAILVAPAALRGLLALGGGAAVTMTGTSTIVAAWHRPADVAAAMLVCLVWVGLVSIGISGRSRASLGEGLAAAVGSGVALAALIGVGVRPLAGWDGFFEAGLVLGAVGAATVLFIAAVCVIAPRTSHWPQVSHASV